MTKIQTAWLIGVVALLAMFRFVPHPPNAVPIVAMALFAGAFFSNRIHAYLVPLVAMILSDLILGFHSTVLYVYAGIMATVVIGSFLNQVTVYRVGLAAVIASIAFFLITNFGAWMHHNMYSQDLNGLLQAYVAGIPFLRNSLIANLIFSYLVFYGLTSFLPVKSLSEHSH